MLQNTENIQSFLQLTGEIMPAWVIIPDKQAESRFPYHKQFVHLDRVCDMFIKNSFRNRNLVYCNSKNLFYLHEDWGYSFMSERLEKTEWARAGLLNRSCTQSCTDCAELGKGRLRKVECRLS